MTRTSTRLCAVKLNDPSLPPSLPQVRYIDPSYQLRSVSANPSDSVYCSDLGSTAVHGAMAGFTCFSAGRINQRYVYIPIAEMCKAKKVGGRVACGLCHAFVTPLSRRLLRVAFVTPLAGTNS